MKLGGKIIWTFVLVAALPVIMMTLLFYLYVESSAERFSLRRSESATAALRLYLEDRLAALANTAEFMMTDTDFLVGVIDFSRRRHELDQILRSHIGRNEFEFGIISVAETDSQLVVASAAAPQAERITLKSLLQDRNTAMSGFYSTVTAREAPVLIAAMPIHYREQNVAQVLLGRPLDLVLNGFPLTAYDLGAIIVVRGDQVLATVVHDTLLQGSLGNIAAARAGAAVWKARLNDHEYFVRSTPLYGVAGGDIGQILLIFDQSLEGANRARLLRALALVALAALIPAILIGYFMQRSLTRPIAETAQAAKRIAAGAAPQRVDYFAEDEIGDLTAAINRLADDLAESDRRLRRSEQIAAWQMFARQTAHELRNYLMPLVTTVAQLQRRIDAGDLNESAARSAVQNIQTEIGRMKQLLTAFAEFARLPEPRKQTLTTATIVESIRATYANAISAGKLHLDCGGVVAEVQADPNQIHQVLVNLINNAFEAQASIVQVRLEIAGQFLRVEVVDDGSGIDAARGDDPFMPLFTTKATGSGLGLAICRRIIVDHGGDIEFRANIPRGTAFSFYLPLRDGK